MSTRNSLRASPVRAIRLAVTLWAALALPAPILAQSQLCFLDDDGARWSIRLEPNGSAFGTVQVPVDGCERGSVIGNYAYANATFPLHLFVPTNPRACVPRSTLSARYTLSGGGEGELIALGFFQDLVLLPCSAGVAPARAGWWSRAGDG